MFTGCSVQLDVVFVLDLSGSVAEAYGLVLELARQTISGLNVDRAFGSRVAVITYSDQATVKFYLDRYSSTADVLNALVFRSAGQCYLLILHPLPRSSLLLSSRLGSGLGSGSVARPLWVSWGVRTPQIFRLWEFRTHNFGLPCDCGF